MRWLLLVLLTGCSTPPHMQEHVARWDAYTATVWLESDDQAERQGAGDERLAELQAVTTSAYSEMLGAIDQNCATDVVWYVPSTQASFEEWCSPSAMGCTFIGDYHPHNLVVLRRDIYENDYWGSHSVYIHELVHITGACAGDSDVDHARPAYWERMERSVWSLARDLAGIPATGW